MKLRILLLSLFAVAASCGTAQAAELIGVCSDSNLCLATEQGKTSKLTEDGSTDAPYSSPAASSDGSVTAFIRNGKPFLAKRRASSPEELLDTVDGRRIRLSPDGESIALQQFSTRVGAGGVFLESSLSIVGEIGTARYSSQSQVLDGAFLGDDELLLGTSFRGGVEEDVCVVAVIPSDGAPPCGRLVATQPGRSVESPSASPDGKLIAAESVTRDADTAARLSGGISIFDAKDGQLVRELTPATGADGRPEFSPDGKQVAFTRGGDTYVVPADGGAAKLLARDFTDADWFGATGAAKLAPKLELKGRKLSAKVGCADPTGCVAAKLTLKRSGGGTPFAVLKVPELASGKGKTVKTKVSAASARLVAAAGKKGLTLSVSGGKPRTVEVVAAG